jgi:AhpD family alkylhydroperoxidase
MDTKIKELIAIGAGCEPCLKVHIGGAKEAGATEEEIRIAVRVGQVVRKGAASKMDEAAKRMLSGGLGEEEVCCPASEPAPESPVCCS